MGQTREILTRIGHPKRPRLPIVRMMAAVAVLVLPLNVLAVWRYHLRARRGAEGPGAERVGDIPPGDAWPLAVMGVVLVPLGLWVFARAERFAKRTGRLKRVG